MRCLQDHIACICRYPVWSANLCNLDRPGIVEGHLSSQERDVSLWDKPDRNVCKWRWNYHLPPQDNFHRRIPSYKGLVLQISRFAPVCKFCRSLLDAHVITYWPPFCKKTSFSDSESSKKSMQIMFLVLTRTGEFEDRLLTNEERPVIFFFKSTSYRTIFLSPKAILWYKVSERMKGSYSEWAWSVTKKSQMIIFCHSNGNKPIMTIEPFYIIG